MRRSDYEKQSEKTSFKESGLYGIIVSELLLSWDWFLVSEQLDYTISGEGHLILATKKCRIYAACGVL